MKASYKIVFALALAFFIVVILVLANQEGEPPRDSLADDALLIDPSGDVVGGPTLGDEQAKVPEVVVPDTRDSAQPQASSESTFLASRSSLASRDPRQEPARETATAPSASTASTGGGSSFSDRFGARTDDAPAFSGFGSQGVRRPGQTQTEGSSNESVDATAVADQATTGQASTAVPDSRVTTFGNGSRVALGNNTPSDGTESAAQESAAASAAPSVSNTAVSDQRTGLDAPTRESNSNSNPSTSSASETVPLPAGVQSRYVSLSTSDRKTYTIKTGDNFAVLASRFYGSQRYWRSFAQANPSVDPTKMQVGQVVRLPNASEITRFGPAAVETADRRQPPAPSASKQHVVRSGQTLSSISKRYYGTTKHWPLIYRTNQNVIGGDPDRLPAGETLVIPPKPSGG